MDKGYVHGSEIGFFFCELLKVWLRVIQMPEVAVSTCGRWRMTTARTAMLVKVFLSSQVHFRPTLGRIIRHLSFFACHCELELASLLSWFWFQLHVERIFTTGVEFRFNETGSLSM